MPALLIAPAQAPAVSTDVVRRYLRIDGSDADDGLIDEIVAAATEYVERSTARALINQTWAMSEPAWPTLITRQDDPVADRYGNFWIGSLTNSTGGAGIRIPVAPAVSLVSVEIGGVVHPTSDFWLDNVNEVIRPASASTLVPGGEVIIHYVAGHGATHAAVPGQLRMLVIQLAAHWFIERQASREANRATGHDVPLHLASALQTWRRRTI